MRATAIVQRFFLLLGGGLALQAQEQSATVLPPHSPFLPAAVATSSALPGIAALELRGVILGADGELLFGIRDPATNSSTFVGMNDSGHDFVVRTFDPLSNVITIAQGSRTYSLRLKKGHLATVSPAFGIRPAPAAAQAPENATDRTPLTATGEVEAIRNRQKELGDAQKQLDQAQARLRDEQLELGRGISEAMRRQAAVNAQARPAPGQAGGAIVDGAAGNAAVRRQDAMVGSAEQSVTNPAQTAGETADSDEATGSAAEISVAIQSGPKISKDNAETQSPPWRR